MFSMERDETSDCFKLICGISDSRGVALVLSVFHAGERKRQQGFSRVEALSRSSLLPGYLDGTLRSDTANPGRDSPPIRGGPASVEERCMHIIRQISSGRGNPDFVDAKPYVMKAVD
jgi:hypothetical protein